jgi:hypothetical protein
MDEALPVNRQGLAFHAPSSVSHQIVCKMGIFVFLPLVWRSVAQLWNHQDLIDDRCYWMESTSCTRYFPKSRLNTTLQMVINGTTPGLWSVLHIEALCRRHIMARYVAMTFTVMEFLKTPA